MTPEEQERLYCEEIAQPKNWSCKMTLAQLIQRERQKVRDEYEPLLCRLIDHGNATAERLGIKLDPEVLGAEKSAELGIEYGED